MWLLINTADALLALSLLMLATTTLYPTILYRLSRGKPVCKTDYVENTSIALVVTAFEEPVELLEKLLRGISGTFDQVIVVWDGRGAEEARRIAEKILGNKLVFISRPRGLGKANALNTALQYVNTDYVVVLDIDDYITPSSIRKLAGCDSTIGLWTSAPGQKMLTEALGEVLTFASRILYSSRCRLGKPVFFLGSGSSVKTSVAHALGGWNENAILEDVEFGLRLLARGYRVCFSEDAIVYIGIPPTYHAFRVQQARWARGAVQLLSRHLGLVIQVGGFEALLYLLQYVLIAFWHPLLLATVLLGQPTVHATIAYLAASSFLLGLAGNTYMQFLVKERGHNTLRALRLAAASTAISASLTPTLLVAIVEGIIGRRVWRRTPKTRTGTGTRVLLPEILYTLLNLYAAYHCLVNGLLVYPLLLLHALAPVYVALRFRGQIS